MQSHRPGFLSLEELKANFDFYEEELKKRHGVEGKEKLEPSRQEFLTQLEEFLPMGVENSPEDLSESQLLFSATCLEIVDQVKSKYHFFNPDGGLFNPGSVTTQILPLVVRIPNLKEKFAEVRKEAAEQNKPEPAIKDIIQSKVITKALSESLFTEENEQIAREKLKVYSEKRSPKEQEMKVSEPVEGQAEPKAAKSPNNTKRSIFASAEKMSPPPSPSPYSSPSLSPRSSRS